MAYRSRAHMFDAELALHMATAGTALDADGGNQSPIAFAAGVGQVNGADKIVDLGSDTANFSGILVVDVGAVAGETTLLVQGSDTADFSGNVINLSTLPLNVGGGHLGGANVDATPQRYESVFLNDQANTIYRYVRLFKVGAGAITVNAYVGRTQGGILA